MSASQKFFVGLAEVGYLAATTTSGGDRIGVHAAFADTNQSGGAVCTPTLTLLGVGRCG